jgi:hypothetical protein
MNVARAPLAIAPRETERAELLTAASSLLRLVALRVLPGLAALLVSRPHLPHARAASEASDVAPRALLQPLCRPAARDAARRDHLALVGVLAEEPERLEAMGRVFSPRALRCAREEPRGSNHRHD